MHIMRRPANWSNDGFTLLETTFVLLLIGLLLLLFIRERAVPFGEKNNFEPDLLQLRQDMKTLRLRQITRPDELNGLQFVWEATGRAYYAFDGQKILFERELHPGNRCLVPTGSRTIYFKSYHSTYAATWYCQSPEDAYQIKFLLGNYQMVVERK